MGLIDKIKRAFPDAGNPQADIDPEDIKEMENQDGSGEDGDSNGEDNDENEDEDQNPGSGGGGNGEDEKDETEEESEEESSGGDQDGEEESQSGKDQDDREEGQSGKDTVEKDETEGNSEDSDLSEEEKQDLMDEMESSSADRDMSDWTGANSEEEDSNFVQDYYETLQDKRADPETEIAKRRSDRDDRSDMLNTSVDSQVVKNKYESRFADEIREAFRKIKTREAPKPSEYGQRPNMRGIVRRRSGDMTEERLYLEMEPSEVGDRCITVVVDGSGSMDELEIKLALMALADAAEQIGDRFAATVYDTESTGWGRGDWNVQTHLVTSPTEEFEIEHLDSFNANGYTPTASGIEDGRSITDITPNSEDVLIVITDGVANIDMDGNKHGDDLDSRSMKQASRQVNTAINEGKRVIGLGVGDGLDDEYMSRIFGNDYFRADMEDIADTLVDIYRRQMETSSR